MTNNTHSFDNNYKSKIEQMLEALGLDVHYHKGEGNTLFYRNQQDEEIAVSDFLGGYGACLFGHNHPNIVQVVQHCIQSKTPAWAQASQRKGATTLAATLNTILQSNFKRPYATVFGSTGAEAVEIALKHAAFSYHQKLSSTTEILALLQPQEVFVDDATAAFLGVDKKQFQLSVAHLKKLQAHNHKISRQPPVVIAIENAFHGKTNAALNTTYNDFFKVEPMSQLANVRFIPPLEDALIKILTNEEKSVFQAKYVQNHWFISHKKHFPVSCVLVEPLQGEGGITPLKSEVARTWQQVCKTHQIPLIADEIQCGMGRTGSFFYSTALGINPDYVLLSKSLGGGFAKISACCIAQDYYLTDFCLKHSSTFAEDNLSSQVAIAAIELAHDPKIIDAIATKGNLLKSALAALKDQYQDIISDVRGEGLMLGIELHGDIDFQSNTLLFLKQQHLLGYTISGYLLKEHCLRIAPTLGKRNVLRLEPSYLVTEDEILRLKKGLEDVCLALRHNNIKKLLILDTGEEESTKPLMKITTEKHAYKKVAFIGHFISPKDLKLWDPFLAGLTDEKYKEIVEKIAPVSAPFMHNEIIISSTQGKVGFTLIGLPISSQQMLDALKGINTAHMQNIIAAAVDEAIAEGCTAVGLGGYSSILTKNGKTLAHKNIHLTTGNSLTVGSALAALFSEAEKMSLKPALCTAAVVGAGGNIGSVMAELLAYRVKKLWLIGRQGNLTYLHTLKEKIEMNAQNLGRPIPDIWITDNLQNLKEADLIATASNAATPIIYPEMLAQKPLVICDVSVPGDIHPTVQILCKQASIIKGGIVSSYKNPELILPGIPLPPGHLFACMTETLLMGLAGIENHFSLGNIKIQQVEEISNLAKTFGFETALPKFQASY